MNRRKRTSCHDQETILISFERIVAPSTQVLSLSSAVTRLSEMMKRSRRFSIDSEPILPLHHVGLNTSGRNSISWCLWKSVMKKSAKGSWLVAAPQILPKFVVRFKSPAMIKFDWSISPRDSTLTQKCFFVLTGPVSVKKADLKIVPEARSSQQNATTTSEGCNAKREGSLL